MFFKWAIKYCKTIWLVVIVVAITIFESNSDWVEHYYYRGVYPKISTIQRTITGWVPFSIGDLLYIFFGCYLLFSSILFIRKCVKRGNRWAFLGKAIIKTINFLLRIYVVFKLLWGLNYSRQGIAHQLKLQEATYCKEDLEQLIEDLIFDANNCRRQINDTSLPKMNVDSIFHQAKLAYCKASQEYRFLSIEKFSIKPSLFSPTGNYLGYTGYYNPFTGESQVRTDIPTILLPFIACHEVAHQLGYASEDEANFVGYLITSQSSNIYFRYSMCLEILDYAFSELLYKYQEDFDTINGLKKRLQFEDCFEPQVKKDRKTIKIFFAKNKKNMSDISSIFYDQYLKANYQRRGLSSYSAVINLILQCK